MKFKVISLIGFDLFVTYELKLKLQEVTLKPRAVIEITNVYIYYTEEELAIDGKRGIEVALEKVQVMRLILSEIEYSKRFLKRFFELRESYTEEKMEVGKTIKITGKIVEENKLLN